MEADELTAVRAELEVFVERVFASLPRTDQRAKGGLYLQGLMLDGRRKSMQPMGERLGVEYQQLQQFISSSPWAVEPVRRQLAAIAMETIEPEAWVIDDTGFAKDGSSSPGVARQYSGTLGKIGNCQVATTIHAATDEASCPVNWRLYLPEAWDDTYAATNEDAAKIITRRDRARIPETVRHRPKWAQGLEMIDEAATWGWAPPLLVGDAGYGDTTAFRLGLDERSIPYVLAVKATTSAHPLHAVPEAPTSASGRGQPAKPRYRTKASNLRDRIDEVTVPGLPHPSGQPRHPPTGGRIAARGVDAGPMARRRARANRLLALLPARGYTDQDPGPDGENAVADRTRLPRTQDRPGPGPL